MDGQVNTPKLLESILIIHYSNSWPGKLKTPKNILCNNSVYSDISDIRVFSRCNWVSLDPKLSYPCEIILKWISLDE